SMDPKDTENEIEKLSHMLSKIQNIYYKKKEQLEELQSEMSELREVLNFLNSLISGKSFHSADEIYSKTLLKKTTPSLEEKYFVEEVPKERVEGTNIKRKIYSKSKDKDEELLSILNFFDMNRVEIKIINPEKILLKETSEDFIRTFIKGALIKIKENNPNMNLKYSYFKDSEYIEYITITQLTSIKEYDIITSKLRELLAKEIKSDG
ncbi:MAG: hypothetical protein ACFE75_08705, partial [Candidatus Hodarchaeota archaeon]